MKRLYKDFAPEFPKIYKALDYRQRGTRIFLSKDEEMSDNLKVQLDFYMNDENVTSEDFVGDGDAWFETTLETDKDTLAKYLEKYYECAEEQFRYWEYEYGGFGSGYACFIQNRTDVLYLCNRYYESVGEKEKAERSMFFALLPYAYTYGAFVFLQKWDRKAFRMFEDRLSVVEKYAYADWQCVIPKLTYKIGKYYETKKDYRNAYRYFKCGASLRYDGRQSEEPYACVAVNQYELGLMYAKGLGVPKNTRMALKSFRQFCENMGVEGVAAMGDIYYTGDGVKKNLKRAFACYSAYNPYNDCSRGYSELTDRQKDRLRKLIADMGEKQRRDFDTLIKLKGAYQFVLKEPEKAEECRVALAESGLKDR